VFLKESQQLADVCEKVYESAKKEEQKFEENLKKMSSEKRGNAMDMLRRFLSTKKVRILSRKYIYNSHEKLPHGS
jgi:hypothetical protein